MVKIISYPQAPMLIICSLLVSSLIVTMPNSQAAPVTVAVTITQVREIICADEPGPIQPCPSDYFAAVKFGDDPFQTSPTVDGGCGIFCGVVGPFSITPFWTFTTTVDNSSVRVLQVMAQLVHDCSCIMVKINKVITAPFSLS